MRIHVRLMPGDDKTRVPLEILVICQEYKQKFLLPVGQNTIFTDVSKAFNVFLFADIPENIIPE